MILMKAIKPKKLSDPTFSAQMRNALKRVGRVIVKEDYTAITQNWSEENKPTLKVHTHVTQSEPSPYIDIEASGEVWNYVNKGTKPHLIFAGIYTGRSKKKALAFPSMFAPKTRPGWVGSSAGKRGGQTLLRAYVSHPGSKARNFDLAIEKKRQTWFKRYMEKAMRDATRTSGHGA